ncbi:hypothetical protein FB451DRAFT_1242966 [Mycena latifolia]|nr:hypothetical protein FB451DRAFT_1242966 [Mycena latifolia]
MGPYPRIPPSHLAGRGRRQDLGFQCPTQDADGSPLDIQDSATIFDQNGDPETLVSCTYDDEEDPCIYFPDDGSLEDGPSTCPIAESPVTPTTAVSPNISPTTSASSSETPAATPSPATTPSATLTSSSSNPLAIGSPGFIGVIVGVALVLLAVGILLGLCIRRRRRQKLRPQSQPKPDNEASRIRPPAKLTRPNEPAMGESQLLDTLDSMVDLANTVSAMYPVTNPDSDGSTTYAGSDVCP